MSVNYTTACINFRLNGVVSAIGNGGLLQVFDGFGVLLVTITLASPCGTVAGGVLTFTVPRTGIAVAGGLAARATMSDSGGTLMINGFTVGIPLSGAEIIVSNGLNTLQFSAGQAITMISGQIVGS